MLGIHKGAFTVVLAETGLGKTELFRYLEYQCLKNTKYTIATCHGEETPLRSLLGLVSYEIGANVTRKDLIDAGNYEAQVKEGIRNLTRDERLYQFSIRVSDGVDEIIDQVRFLATAMEVDFIFLEPIQDFVSASNTSEKESLLTDLSNKLKRLAPELNVGIVVIAHANKDGEAKYCASIIQSAAYEIRLERDVDNEDPDVRNTTQLFIGRKNRTGGGSGPAGRLYFDKETYMLTPDLGPQEPVMDHSSSTVVGF
jgi:replicative DNA helicase